jgi:two-component system chemotaxis sensor kinase CheA
MTVGFFATILDAVVLPKHVSAFERSYLQRMNRVGLVFFALHVPALTLFAFLNDTGPLLTLGIALGIFAGPALAYATLDRPRLVSVVYGVTAMLMGGLLVHVGQGPVQIEMHFYFFALIAMLALFGNPMAIVAAAVTVALHHLALWLVLPASVFNYDAPVWVVAVHAAFVVLESIATCFIARSFFDNVIGLEKIVTARTLELDGRNRDMRLVLDNVGQGFLTVDLDAVVSAERSAIVRRWLGDGAVDQTFGGYLRRIDTRAAEAFELGFIEVVEQVMPLELTLDQLPKRTAAGAVQLELSYSPIFDAAGKLERVLIVMTDVSAQVASEQLEAQQREVLRIFGNVARDRVGFLEFFEESSEQVRAIVDDAVQNNATLTRIVHTLKGNTSMFGVQSVADLCHRLESTLIEDAQRPDAAQRAQLQALWSQVDAHLGIVLGDHRSDRLEIDQADFEKLMQAAQALPVHAPIASMLESLRLEPAGKRLQSLADQAQGIARRLDKLPLQVDVEGQGVRLDASTWAPFWGSFVHLLRNAVDHGLESREARVAAGKDQTARLRLSTRMVGEDLLVEIADDGRGIDWQRVAQVAASKGVAHGTRAELVEAIFCDGVSTSTQVTELSGRGVGMGAVRSACEARGGTIAVHSEPGAGTRISFRFPQTTGAMRPQHGAQHAA